MNAHTLTVLEFGKALEKVAGRAATAMGKESIFALRPQTEEEEVRAELARVGEAMDLLAQRPNWAPPTAPDAREMLRALESEGSSLSAPDLLIAGRLLEASRVLAEALDEWLSRLAERLVRLPEIESRLDRIVDEEGAVRDDASKVLFSLRKNLRAAKARVVKRLEAFMASLPEEMRVEGASVSVRDGRYVIPVRREGRSTVGGIVHGESSTGATLFVEPPLAMDLMNEIRAVEREEEREVGRILKEATDRLRPERDGIEGAFEALVDFDTLWARALTARAWEASVPSILGGDDRRIEISGGRHPLLLEKGEAVVPFWLTLGPEERVVIVSGPNTGGKTVFLKAVGLIQLLAQSGIVPPVEDGTELPVLDEILADIGDEQSIAESLSTFSAHLANAREIVEQSGPNVLVLVDELGTGTDPSEGAALARAIIEVLVERGSWALITSHMGALKRLDSEGSGIVNASLLFDSERMAPTYRLQMGRPGRSYGLAIARRLGFPAQVLDRAEGHLRSVDLKLETLLERLEEKERALSDALREAEATHREAERLRADAEAREATLEERERTAEARARERTRALLIEARREVEEAIRDVRSAASAEAESAESRARRRVESAVRAHEARESRPPPTRRGRRVEVAEGDPVTVVASGARGVVRELRDDRVTVEVGSVRLQLPKAEVEPTGNAEAPSRSARSERRGGTTTIPELHVSTETDLRGLRVDEVDLAVGRALDGALVADLSEIRIIHGMGTGAVRARVREILAADSRVASFRGGAPGEGGAGVTIAVLGAGA